MIFFLNNNQFILCNSSNNFWREVPLAPSQSALSFKSSALEYIMKLLKFFYFILKKLMDNGLKISSVQK